jgi:hypothetical protein
MAHQYADVYVSSPDKVPKGPHWAIIRGSSVHHEAVGVWAPGHGYPAHTEAIVTYEAYLTEDKFKEALESNAKSSYPDKVIGIYISHSYSIVSKAEVVKT